MSSWAHYARRGRFAKPPRVTAQTVADLRKPLQLGAPLTSLA